MAGNPFKNQGKKEINPNEKYEKIHFFSKRNKRKYFIREILLKNQPKQKVRKPQILARARLA